MDQLKKKSFRDLLNMTNDVANKFFFAKKMHDMKNEDMHIENDYNDDYPCDHYLLKVQEAYSALSEAEQNLINNEFFYQSYHKWWEPLYSKATFYRYKKEAMKKFLGAFYDS